MLVAPFALALALLPADTPAPRAAKAALPAKGGKAALAEAEAVKRRIAAAKLAEELAVIDAEVKLEAIRGGKRPFYPPAPPTTTSSEEEGFTGTLSTIGNPQPGDEAVLKAAKVPSSDSSLLNFFRKRTPPAPDVEKIEEVVKKLSAKDASERDEGFGELVCLGPAAIPVLRQVANNVDDIDASVLAKACLAQIEGPAASALPINVARLVAQRKPAGATEVLLGYLPYADDEKVFQEVEVALVAVAVRAGKADPSLIKALKDKVAIRRGAAAQVLCQAGGSAHHAAVRPLLKDSKPSVRLRAALGLVGAFDAEAIPVLIDLLGTLPPKMRKQADDYLLNLAGEWAVAGPRGHDATSAKLRREVWKTWWDKIDGETLLEEFKSRTLTDADRDKAQGLIKKLGDSSPTVRDAAMEDLLGMGKKVSSLLRQAIATENADTLEYAKKTLEAIEKDAPNPMPGAAPRLLGLRKPEGTVKALLAYLPFAESPAAVDQIIDVLAGVGVVGGKPDAVLVEALKDKVGVRRAAAAVALVKGQAVKEGALVKALLSDKDLDVRLRTARALANTGEKKAIPVLIDLLGELPMDQVYDVEEYLQLVAGDKAPSESIPSDVGGRTKAVDAWKAWWKDAEEKTDLAKVDLVRRELGYTLIIEQYSPTTGRGKVMELDAAGKVRWEVGNLYSPYDAKVLRNGNILVCEGSSLIERDKTGKMINTRYYSSIFSAEPIRDGTTFVATRNYLYIVDSKGTQLKSHYEGGYIIAATRFRNGEVAYLTNGGQYRRLDKDFKTIKTITFPTLNGISTNGAEILKGDRVLVANTSYNKVTELDATGKEVFSVAVTYPSNPHRLSNGHTMVCHNSNQEITIYDKSGNVVKNMKGLPYRPFKATRR